MTKIAYICFKLIGPWTNWNFRYIIFNRILVIDGWGISCEMSLDWWSVNIGSGNGLVLSGNKPLPEPVLTEISVAMWCHLARMS